MKSPRVTHRPAGVFLGDAYCGDAPLTLSSAQLRHLLPIGAILMDTDGCSGEASGIAVLDDGAIMLTRPGHYLIHSCFAPQPHDVHHRGSTDVDAQHNKPLRDAQFMCGVFGLLMINAIIFFDASNRLGNVKDFAINYASDMLAVGSILVLAEFYRKGARRGEGNVRKALPYSGD